MVGPAPPCRPSRPCSWHVSCLNECFGHGCPLAAETWGGSQDPKILVTREPVPSQLTEQCSVWPFSTWGQGEKLSGASFLPAAEMTVAAGVPHSPGIAHSGAALRGRLVLLSAEEGHECWVPGGMQLLLLGWLQPTLDPARTHSLALIGVDPQALGLSPLHVPAAFPAFPLWGPGSQESCSWSPAEGERRWVLW